MKMRGLRLWIATSVLFFLQATTSWADTDLQQWTAWIVQKDLTEGVRGYLELQPRFSSDWSLLERVIVRPALLFPSAAGITPGVGYTAISILQPANSSEQRLWEQVQIESKGEWGSITNRSRLEQRFVDGADGADGAAWRLRHQVKALIGLGDESPWAIAASDEVFFHLNSVNDSIQSGFDQNRAFLGVSRKFTSEWRAEGGYLLNSVNKPTGTPDRVNHVFVLTLFWNPGAN